MRIVSHRLIRGPNVYHPKPLLSFQVDMEDLYEKETLEYPNFNKGILKALPGLAEHHCSFGEPGGFLKRLDEGTYFSHTLEHIVLELNKLSGLEVSFGKARYSGKGRIYDIFVRYKCEEAMKTAFHVAIELVEKVLQNLEVDVQSMTQRIAGAVISPIGPSTQAIVDAAKKANVPYKLLGNGSLVQLGWGAKQRRVQTAVSDRTSLIAADIVQDKFITKKFLEDAFIPVPQGRVVVSDEDLEQAFSVIKPPYVLKPLDGNHGRGVFIDLQSADQARQVFNELKIEFSTLLLEEYCQGQDYRVLVINHKFSAAALREPPYVMGDGTRTINELIKVLNQDPLRKEGHEGLLTKVELDEAAILKLNKQGLHPQSVPEKNQKVVLRDNANLSSGGTAKDVTHLVSPEVRRLCERISRVVGLDICGIDIIAKDLSGSLDGSLRVIEVNAGPGLRMHLPYKTFSGRTVGEEILNLLMPQSNGRIPIVSVTGTNGKTSVVKMLQKAFSYASNRVVGHTSTEGVWLGNDKIVSGDCSGPASADVLLNDPQVDLCVLEVARGGLMRSGLAYDWSDAAIITNVTEDHLGQNGLKTVGDLVWVKSLLAERVKKGGVLVLNADDSNSYSIRENPRVLEQNLQVLLYSTMPNNPRIEQHLAEGKDAIWVENRNIYLKLNGVLSSLGSPDEFPVTSFGELDFQVSNLLSVLGCTLALHEKPQNIIAALREFIPSLENPGRMNIYKVHDAYVVLDYGHNPDAIENVGLYVSNKGLTSKVLVGLPGDRNNGVIRKSAESLGRYFGEIYLREEEDLRGRNPGEVSEIVVEHLRNSQPNKKIVKLQEEGAALKGLLGTLKANEILVVLYEDLQAVQSVLREFDPVPVAGVQGRIAPRAIPSIEEVVSVS